MQLNAVKNFIFELRGIQETGEYLSYSDTRYVLVTEKSKKTLNTTGIEESAKNAFATICHQASLERSEKERLCRGLAQSIEDFLARRQKDGSKTTPVVERLTAQLALIKKQVACYATESPQQEQDQFIQKALPAAIEPSSPSGQTYISEILEELKKNSLLSDVLDAWYRLKQQKPQFTGNSLLACMTTELQGGTCYGQAMTILELLGKQEAQQVTVEYLGRNMHAVTFLRYQIIHILYNFLVNHSTCKYIYGIEIPDVPKGIEILQKKLPYSKKRQITSEEISLAKYDRETLSNRLSDFVRNDINKNDNSNYQNYAIYICIHGKAAVAGHAIIVYYNKSQKRYFLYDPYSRAYGFFASDTASVFFKGVSERIRSYQKLQLDSVQFIAYRFATE